MKYLVLTLRKPTFDSAVRPDHYAFLESLRDQGILEQAGPFMDQSGGAYVIMAQNLEEAHSIAKRDPLHIKNCSSVTVYEWDA